MQPVSYSCHIEEPLPPGWIMRKVEGVVKVFEIKDMKIKRCLRVSGQDLLIMLNGHVYKKSSLADFGNVTNRTIHWLGTLHICPGITSKEYVDYTGDTFYREQWCDHSGRVNSSLRNVSCSGGSSRPGLCTPCKQTLRCLKKREQRKNNAKKVISCKASFHAVHKERLALALKQTRRSNQLLKKQLGRIQKKLRRESVEVSAQLHSGLQHVMETEARNGITNPLCRLFWQEQSKAFSKGIHKWHPMMIRLALLIHSQSPSSYRSLRDIGVLKLPGESTLRDYTNLTSPQQGFQLKVIEDLRLISKDLPENQRYVILLHDEMSIKSDLVYDSRSGEIVGLTFDDKCKASHVLAFMVVGITADIKFPLAYFGTSSVTSAVLFPLFWRAVYYLEAICGLKVVASVADKASSNQKFVDLHNGHYAENFMANPPRKLFFLSDAPHLLKTLRNNLANSGSGKKSRFLWNNGKYLLWDHIRDIYMDDSKHELRRTKLRAEHVNLTSYSCMKVYLAAQVMSETVGKVMQKYGPPEASETANFILLIDRLFDCLNTRSEKEAICKRKPDLLPFKSVEDPRFKFLEEEVLGYLNRWKTSVEQRSGFSRKDKEKMFLSKPTVKGLETTVQSVIGLTRYLLSNGVKAVYTSRLNQDPLESHFSKQRALGRRNDNPSLYQYGYQDNKIRIQRSVASALRPKGNVRKQKLDIDITQEPLKKRARKTARKGPQDVQ